MAKQTLGTQTMPCQATVVSVCACADPSFVTKSDSRITSFTDDGATAKTDAVAATVASISLLTTNHLYNLVPHNV